MSKDLLDELIESEKKFDADKRSKADSNAKKTFQNRLKAAQEETSDADIKKSRVDAKDKYQDHLKKNQKKKDDAKRLLDAEKNAPKANEELDKAKKEYNEAQKKFDKNTSEAEKEKAEKKLDKAKEKAKDVNDADKLKAKRNASEQEQLAWMIFKQKSRDPKKKVKPEKSKKGEESKPHLSGQTLIKGNLVKGHFLYKFADDNIVRLSNNYFNYNAFHYLGSIDEGDLRDIYREDDIPADCYRFYDEYFPPNFNQKYKRENIDIEGVETYIAANRISRPVVKYAEKLKKQADGKGQTGNSLPYNWQGHHILPMNCFFGAFTTEEIAIILRSKYDINDGVNIIFLPGKKEEYSMKYHKLPLHNSNHPKYNKKIKRNLKDIKKTIAELKKGPHKALNDKIEEDLHKMETFYFKYISKDYGMKEFR